MELIESALYTVLWLSPFILGALVVLGCCVFVVGACNDFRVGLWMVAVIWVLDTVTMGQPILYVGIQLYVTDLPMVLVASAAALRWIGASQVPWRHPAWVLLACAFMAALFLGLATHGTSAGVQARPGFSALAVTTYALSFPIGRPQLRAMLMALAWAALMVVLLSVYRWVVTFAPIPSLQPPGGVYDPNSSAWRVVHSHVALLLAQAALVGVLFFGSGLAPHLARVLTPASLMTVLALQHRSVWLAGLTGACIGILLARSSRAPWWQQWTLALAAVAMLAAPMLASDALMDQVQSSARAAVQGEGTVAARFGNWKTTVSEWLDDGPVAIAVGKAPGGDTLRTYKTETGQVAAIRFGVHNNYLTMLTSHGVLGFAAWLLVVSQAILALLRLRRAGGETAEAASMLLVLLCCQFAYYVAYDVDYLQALILGTAMAWAFQQRRDARLPDARPSPPQSGHRAGFYGVGTQA